MTSSRKSKPQATSATVSTAEPPTAFEEIIQLYLRDVDRTLIRANLALSPTERLRKLEEFVDFLESMRQAHRVPD